MFAHETAEATATAEREATDGIAAHINDTDEMLGVARRKIDEHVQLREIHEPQARAVAEDSSLAQLDEKWRGLDR
jgi:hypothetical protein